MNKYDRFQKATGLWSGDTNAKNRDTFDGSLAQPFSLTEWAQPNHTCETGIVRSRLDRFYCNQHLADQLDCQLECVALDFPYQLSAHRPISFARRHCKRSADASPPLQVWTISHEAWAPIVKETFSQRCRFNPQAKTLQRIQFLKQAMRHASSVVRRKALDKVASCVEDRISATMMMIRAQESCNHSRVKAAVSLYPRLKCWMEASSANLSALKDHAIALSREHIWSRVDELKQIQAHSGNEFATQNMKESIINQLKRLLPGSSVALSAMRDKDGRITTDPKNMADIVNDHWGNVFSRKEVALHKLRSWLSDVPRIGRPDDGRWVLSLKTCCQGH